MLKVIIISLLGNPITRSISKIPSIKSLALRYVGAESIDSFINKIDEILSSGYRITISFLGEHYSSKDKVEKYKDNLIDIIQKVSNYQGITVSVKLTALGLLIDYDYCKNNLGEVLSVASQINMRVHIDMEESVYVDNILNIFDTYRKDEKYNNLDITFQSYLYRTSKDIEDRILSFIWDTKPIIRICKGAYKEPFDKVFPNKKLVDENYYNLSVKMLDNVEKVYPAFATHDHRLIEKIKNYVQYRGISKENFEFQMLFGVRPELQKKVIEQGYNLRLYVPIGSDWYEYFVRRIAEKPSNLLLILYSLIKK
ncbi:MAG: proline dehydrogenase family protein [Candidatus Calescibacterium sp.]|nr:proline dehydrogenase family protein [Candidatus Calescibacterium sp.]MCX7758382.1 proline dehydrogenase family protein [bacterium]